MTQRQNVEQSISIHFLRFGRRALGQINKYCWTLFTAVWWWAGCTASLGLDK